MKKLSKRDWAILIVLVICLLPVGIAIGRLTKETPVVETPPFNTNVADFSRDSLIKLKEASDKEIARLHKENDSLKGLKAINHINVNHHAGKIKIFTPNSRRRWADSVFRAEGIRHHNMSLQ